MARRDIMFPGATDVVRVCTKRWKRRHAAILQRILKQIEAFLRDHADLPIDELLLEFERQDPHVRAGEQDAHVLYGPRKLFSDERGELQADIRGLVFRPINQLVVTF